MILIFGGVYQGKLSYALEQFGLCEDDVRRCSEDDTRIPEGRRIIYELDKWILALVRAGLDSDAQVRTLAEISPEAIIICNDISCGVVPAEPELRAWREAVGRAVAALSKNSDEVIRLFCGIPAKLK